MGPTWVLSAPMLAPGTLLSGYRCKSFQDQRPLVWHLFPPPWYPICKWSHYNSCWPQVSPMLAPGTLLSGYGCKSFQYQGLLVWHLFSPLRLLSWYPICKWSHYNSLEIKPLHWRHNDHDGVSNHQLQGCLLNRLYRRRSKKTSKLRVTALCAGNSPGPVNSQHKWPVTWKMFPFDDVIMTHVDVLYKCPILIYRKI